MFTLRERGRKAMHIRRRARGSIPNMDRTVDATV